MDILKNALRLRQTNKFMNNQTHTPNKPKPPLKPRLRVFSDKFIAAREMTDEELSELTKVPLSQIKETYQPLTDRQYYHGTINVIACSYDEIT